MVLLIGAPGRRNNTYRWMVTDGWSLLQVPSLSRSRAKCRKRYRLTRSANYIDAPLYRPLAWRLSRMPCARRAPTGSRLSSITAISSMHSMNRHPVAYRTFSCRDDAYPTVLPALCVAQAFSSVATRSLTLGLFVPWRYGQQGQHIEAPCLPLRLLIDGRRHA